jgi:hypothetical protein
MFEKEIEFIYNYNLNKLQQLGSFITYEQLLSTDIHPALLQYVSAEIDFLIYEDREKLLKDSLFDYSGDVIVEHFAGIGEEIKKTKKFSLEYLTKLLLHASSFNVNYIIRPKWSLLQFVFENDSNGQKQIVEVKQILNYLYYYPYLKRLLVSFFDKKRIISITLAELEEVLNKIDKINYESNFDKILDNAFEGMSEFINMGETRNTKISQQVVELFLADKGLTQYKAILTEKYGVNGSNKFEISDFKKTILNYNSTDDDSSTIEERDEIINQKVEELKNESVDNSEEEIILEQDDVVREQSNDTEEEITIPETTEEIISDEVTEKKSFLESHIENLEEDSENDEAIIKTEEEITDSSIEEIEPIDIDEAPRVDDENIEEVYEFITEEEELNEIVEDKPSELERIELEENEETDIILEENEEATVQSNTGFIEEGTSVTFSSEDLSKKVEAEEEDKTTLDTTANDWPTESSVEKIDNELSVEELLEETDASSIIDEVEKEEIEEEVAVEESNDDENVNEVLEEEKESEEVEETQQALFTDKDFEDETEENISESENETDDSTDTPIVDISLLLENKKIAKIIEVVFDYDMEEFANAIDEISECKSEVEALSVIDKIAKETFIDSSVKEIKIFKNIISDFFK